MYRQIKLEKIADRVATARRHKVLEQEDIDDIWDLVAPYRNIFCKKGGDVRLRHLVSIYHILLVEYTTIKQKMDQIEDITRHYFIQPEPEEYPNVWSHPDHWQEQYLFCDE